LPAESLAAPIVTPVACYHRLMTMIVVSADPQDAPGDQAASLSAAACLFHGFSDASRLLIVRHLALGDHRVVDLTQHLGLAQSTVSKHLACLRDCGLVESRPQGRASMFSLTHPQATLDLLSEAERLLGLTGDAVALCPVYGRDARP
jgi:DNA-binding transcriptional ArsR family regulator